LLSHSVKGLILLVIYLKKVFLLIRPASYLFEQHVI